MADRYPGRPFRADGSYDRANPQPSQAGESDPLAELARLIGQADPFSSFGRDERNAGQGQAPHVDDHVEDHLDDEVHEHVDPEIEASPGPPSWMQRVNRREAPLPEPHYDDERYSETYPEANSQYPAEPPYVPQRPAAAPAGFDRGYRSPRQELPRQDAHYMPATNPERYDDALYGPSDHADDQRYDQHAERYPEDPYGQRFER